MMRAELWARLGAAGLASGEMPREDAPGPWYVRLMLGIAGCIAAAFLIGFIAVGLEFVVQSKPGSVLAGSLMIASAYVLFLTARSDFSAMFGFAVSLAGQALLAYGLFRLLEGLGRATPWLVMAAVEAALAVAMANYIHRLASAYAAVLLLAGAFALSGAGALAPAIAAAAVAYIWLNELRSPRLHATLQPIAYGLTLGLIHVETFNWGGKSFVSAFARPNLEDWARPWMGECLVLATLLVVVWRLLQRAGWAPREPRSLIALAIAAAIGAASLKAPGVAAGFIIVVLGFANGNRVLWVLGIAALLLYVSGYYYLLDATLLFKAGVLAAAGAVLLGARWLMLKRILPDA
jgi:uncharacterized membrane protein